MAASLPATLLGLEEEELRHQNQQLQHSPGEGASAVMASSPPAGASYPGIYIIYVCVWVCECNFIFFGFMFVPLRIYLQALI